MKSYHGSRGWCVDTKNGEAWVDSEEEACNVEQFERDIQQSLPGMSDIVRIPNMGYSDLSITVGSGSTLFSSSSFCLQATNNQPESRPFTSGDIGSTIYLSWGITDIEPVHFNAQYTEE